MTSTLEHGAPAPPAPRRRGGRRRLVAVAVVLVAAFCYLLVEGLGNALDYYETVDQALAHRASLGTSTLRLEGLVVKGSVRRTSSGADFSVSGSAGEVKVVNHGSPPQLFQPDIPVIVVGHFVAGRADVFVSDQIMVKHSAQYIAEHPGRVRAPNGSVR